MPSSNTKCRSMNAQSLTATPRGINADLPVLLLILWLCMTVFVSGKTVWVFPSPKTSTIITHTGWYSINKLGEIPSSLFLLQTNPHVLERHLPTTVVTKMLPLVKAGTVINHEDEKENVMSKEQLESLHNVSDQNVESNLGARNQGKKWLPSIVQKVVKSSSNQQYAYSMLPVFYWIFINQQFAVQNPMKCFDEENSAFEIISFSDGICC